MSKMRNHVLQKARGHLPSLAFEPSWNQFDVLSHELLNGNREFLIEVTKLLVEGKLYKLVLILSEGLGRFFKLLRSSWLTKICQGP